MNLGSLVRLGPIAKGGMGSVELAAKEDGDFRRLYAVKRMHPHCLDDPELRAMFMDEARIAGLMHHANVVAVVDVGEDEAGPYLVMNYVDGLAVDRLLACMSKRGTLMPLQVGVRIALEVAKGLHAAHELCTHDGTPLNVIHRDITPHNILVAYDGTIRITDFGVAKALGRNAKTTSGVLKGKVAYMSPEQLRFEELTRRSDLFSLGVVLFEMLSGKRLYRSEDSRKTIRRILDESPPDIAESRPGAPPELVSLLFDLLTKDPEQRLATAELVAEELQAILARLVAEEGTIKVRSFIEPVTAEFRKSQQEHLNETITRATASLSDESLEAVESIEDVDKSLQHAPTQVDATPIPAQRRTSIGTATFIVFIAVGVASAASWAWMTSEPEDHELTKAAAILAEPEVAPDDQPEVGAVLVIPAEEEEPDPHVTTESMAPEASLMRRPRRRGMRQTTMAAPAEETSMANWEEW